MAMTNFRASDMPGKGKPAKNSKPAETSEDTAKKPAPKKAAPAKKSEPKTDATPVAKDSTSTKAAAADNKETTNE